MSGEVKRHEGIEKEEVGMGDDVYIQVAETLNALPQGFPRTKSGVEIQLLRRLFTPEEAAIFRDLEADAQSIKDIAARTSRDSGELKEILQSLAQRRLVLQEDEGGEERFALKPWMWLHDDQLDFLDEEFARLSRQYLPEFMGQLLSTEPHFTRTIPVREPVENNARGVTYGELWGLMERADSIWVGDCICRLEQQMIDKGCDKPVDVCIGICLTPESTTEIFDDDRRVSSAEAKGILERCDEAALVPMTTNIEDVYFVCMCCGCCCQFLTQVNALDAVDNWALVNSKYYARIDQTACTSCGVCVDRCQVHAIGESNGGVYTVRDRKCIGCGLCVTGCPAEAVELLEKSSEDLRPVFKDEEQWGERRILVRGASERLSRSSR